MTVRSAVDDLIRVTDARMLPNMTVMESTTSILETGLMPSITVLTCNPPATVLALWLSRPMRAESADGFLNLRVKGPRGDPSDICKTHWIEESATAAGTRAVTTRMLPAIVVWERTWKLPETRDGFEALTLRATPATWFGLYTRISVTQLPALGPLVGNTVETEAAVGAGVIAGDTVAV